MPTPDQIDTSAFRAELKKTTEQIAAKTDAQIIADKELRSDLDAQLQKLKAMTPSRERAISITKIQEAIMWLCVDLKRLSDARPYHSSYDPSNAHIEPTADGLKL